MRDQYALLVTGVLGVVCEMFFFLKNQEHSNVISFGSSSSGGQRRPGFEAEETLGRRQCSSASQR